MNTSTASEITFSCLSMNALLCYHSTGHVFASTMIERERERLIPEGETSFDQVQQWDCSVLRSLRRGGRPRWRRIESEWEHEETAHLTLIANAYGLPVFEEVERKLGNACRASSIVLLLGDALEGWRLNDDGIHVRVQLREHARARRPVYIFGTFSLPYESSSWASWKNLSPSSFAEDENRAYGRRQYITNRFIAHVNDRAGTMVEIFGKFVGSTSSLIHWVSRYH